MFDNHNALAERGGEIAAAGFKAAPAVAVTTAASAGMTLEEWVFTVTLIYLVLQILHLGWKWARDLKRDRAERLKEGAQ
ncbi:hypothetical protein [Alteraurantiacibacter palmitatis]|uniref:Holin n=1 Tax=Alteraurantiacibacter palmitatis TaxID=2054628 RepID=A0ABV7E426_9SPHN